MVLKALIAATALFAATAANAQTLGTLETVSTCKPTETIAAEMMSIFAAEPLLTGTGTIAVNTLQGTTEATQGYFALWVNQDTGFFSATISFVDDITCLLSIGEDFEPFSQ